MSQITGNPQNESISRYEIMSELGSGGMGVVYKAIDPYLQKVFALKVLNTKNVSDDMKVRFQKEAKALKDLRHNAIPEVFNFGISRNDEPYMVMEFVEGKSLQQVLEEHKKLPAHQTIKIVEQICDALAYAHDNKILHRDIKPANVIIEPTFEQDKAKVKVIDFGLAKLEKNQNEEQDMTKSGLVIGSPPYMSPEQITGQKIDGRSDIYSLGCVLFELLTGNRPFIGRNALETISMHISNPPPSVCEQEGESKIYSELDSIISKCLQKERNDRYQSMTELKEKLVKIVESESVSSIDSLSDIESNDYIPIGKFFNNVDDTISFESQSVTQEINSTKTESSTSIGDKQDFWVNIKLLFCIVTLVIFVAGASVYYQSTTGSKLEPNVNKTKITEVATLNPANKSYKKESYRTIENLLNNGVFDSASLAQRNSTFRFEQKNGLTIARANPDTTDTSLGLAVKTLPACNFWDLNKTKISSAGLKHLLNYKIPITNISLGGTAIDSKAITHLKKIKGLTTLSISGGNMLTDDDISNLKSIPLRFFSIGGDNLTSKTIDTVGQMKTLHGLTIIRISLYPENAEKLTNLKNLRKLELRAVPLTEKICSQLARIPKLSTLVFGYYNSIILPSNIEEFQNASKLRTLKFINTPVSKQSLQAVMKLKNLKKLDLKTAIVKIDLEDILTQISNDLPNCKIIPPDQLKTSKSKQAI